MGRRPSPPASHTGPHTGPRTIELAIRLSDGSFETKVIVPIDATDKERDSAIQRWLGLAAQALALGVENLSATLPRDGFDG